MRHRNFLTFLLIGSMILFVSACGKQNLESADGNGSNESVAKRIEYEENLKKIANEANFIVSIKAGRTYFSCTGFFFDSRGYILTARHCVSMLRDGEDPVFSFADGREHVARVVGEVQTLDLVVLASRVQREFSSAEFADLPAIIKPTTTKPEKFSFAESLALKERMVVIRCVSRDTGPPLLDRIYIGEFLRWNKGVVSVSLSQTDTDGCSGGPILNLNNRVIGMLQERIGIRVEGVDVENIKAAVAIIVARDLARNN